MCNLLQKKARGVLCFLRRQDQVIQILTSNKHVQFVTFWHLISNLWISLSFVKVLLMLYFPQNLNKWRNLHFLSLYISCCSQYDWLSINIQTLINDKTQSFINEWRSLLLDCNFWWISSFKIIKVLSSSELSSFSNIFAFFVASIFKVISVGIIFSSWLDSNVNNTVVSWK